MEIQSEPVIVEFAGLPAAGKTTATKLLVEHLHTRGFIVEVIHEAAALSPLGDLKRNWRFNAWTLCHTTKRLLEVLAKNEAQIVVVDRGLFDSFCWIEWFKMTQAITKDTANALQSFATLPEWSNFSRLIFYLGTSFENALHRRGRVGRIMNLGTYSELQAAYQRGIIAFASQKGVPIKSLSTTNMTRDEVVNCVVKELNAVLQVRKI